MKKIFVSTISALLLIIALTTTAFAAPAVEQERFKGSLQAVEYGVFNPGPPASVAVTGYGSGIASQLGRFTYSYTVLIPIPLVYPVCGNTYYTFVAANGDRFYSVGASCGVPAPGIPNTNHVVEMHTITGGTGRFAGATGKFTIDRLITLGSPGNPTSGTFDGYIVLVDE
jgi:hypothetical protein